MILIDGSESDEDQLSRKCTLGQTHIFLHIIPGGPIHTVTPRNGNPSFILKSPTSVYGQPGRMREVFPSAWTTDHTKREKETAQAGDLGQVFTLLNLNFPPL